MGYKNIHNIIIMEMVDDSQHWLVKWVTDCDGIVTGCEQYFFEFTAVTKFIEEELLP